MDMDSLLSKHSGNYRFHGVRSATLARLVEQSTNSAIRLWGTDVDEHIDNQDGEVEAEYQQGAGYLYTVSINHLEMACTEFCDEGGLVLVLEKVVSTPFEFEHPDDGRQLIIKVEEYKVIGGISPVFDEDGDLVEQEAVSLEEILEG